MSLNKLNIILFDAEERKELLPLTYTRPVSELKVGILTISEKWKRALKKEVSFLTEKYLSKKYKLIIKKDNLLINGSLIPNKLIIQRFSNLKNNEVLICDGNILAARMGHDYVDSLSDMEDFAQFSAVDISGFDCVVKINNLWDLFQLNDQEIKFDFKLLTKSKKSTEISSTNTIIGNGEVFLEKGAKVEAAILNTTQGPIYIAKDAEIMEGSMIRGPFSLGEHSVVKMGSKIYGATSIGKHCKVGGEINNSIFHSYSNKAHDGFLGNAVIGEWCNIGAGANNSNLKNNYAEVKIWNYEQEKFINTNSQFCGLFMGDHSKVAINTMFNTGTVIGVSANIFGPGFPRIFIPSFSWGGNHGFNTFKIDKAYETAKIMMGRRDLKLDKIEKDILMKVYTLSAKYRAWEK